MQTNEDKKHRKEQVQSLSPTVLFPFTHLKKKKILQKGRILEEA